MSLTFGVNRLLTHTLSGTYTLDRVLLARAPYVPETVPFESVTTIDAVAQASSTDFPSLPVGLNEIRTRGYLRVGVKTTDYPWAFHGARGRLVGYDLDIIQSVANFSGLPIRIIEAPLDVLEHMLQQQQLDMAIGGIEKNGYRSARIQTSIGYQTAHKALVVWPDRIAAVQSAEQHRLQRPLRIAVADTYLPSPDAQDRIQEYLGSPGPSVPVTFVRIPSVRDFVTDRNTTTHDALLITAEGGSSWSVMFPSTDVITPFYNHLPTQMVMLLGGNDPAWLRYVDDWIALQADQLLFDRLYAHWISVVN
jgi:hypothetical protein